MRELKRYQLPLTIHTYPSTFLVARNRPIDNYNDETHDKVLEMFELMYKHGGVGLAAPQVGWNVQLFILNLSGKKELAHQEQVIWNPTLVTNGNLVAAPEACLSFPKISAMIERSAVCRLNAHSPTGLIEKEFRGFGAQAVQHEMDHLEGILFHERMSKEDYARNEPLIRALADAGLKRK